MIMSNLRNTYNKTMNQTRKSPNHYTFYYLYALIRRAGYCGRYSAYFACVGKLLNFANAIIFKVGSFRNCQISFSTQL